MFNMCLLKAAVSLLFNVDPTGGGVDGSHREHAPNGGKHGVFQSGQAHGCILSKQTPLEGSLTGKRISRLKKALANIFQELCLKEWLLIQVNFLHLVLGLDLSARCCHKCTVNVIKWLV